MKKEIAIILGLILSLALITASCAPEAGGQTAEEFYKGKTIKIIVGFTPGAGADTISRVAAKYLPGYTGATVVVENMPGQAGLKSTNFMYTTADPDGLTLAASALPLIEVRELVDDPGVLWKSLDFGYLTGIGETGSILVVKRDGPYKSLDDIKRAKGFKWVGPSPRDSLAFWSYLLSDALNLDAKFITVRGRAKALLALEQGETDGHVSDVGWYTGFKAKLLPIAVMGDKRDPIAPDVPTITELMEFSSEQEKIRQELLLPIKSLHVFFAPPGVPEDRLDFLRKAFKKIEARDDYVNDILQIKPSPLINRKHKEIEDRLRTAVKNKARLKELSDAWVDKYRP